MKVTKTEIRFKTGFQQPKTGLPKKPVLTSLIWYTYIQKYVCICACHCVIWTMKYMNTCMFVVVICQPCLSFFCSSSQQTIWCFISGQHTSKSCKWQSQSGGSFLCSSALCCWRLLNWHIVLLFTFCKRVHDSTYASNHNCKPSIFLVFKIVKLRIISLDHKQINHRCSWWTMFASVKLRTRVSTQYHHSTQVAPFTMYAADNRFKQQSDSNDQIRCISCTSLLMKLDLKSRQSWGNTNEWENSRQKIHKGID